MESILSAQTLIDAAPYIARVLGLLVAIPVHEVAHAWVSYKLGDPTAKEMGRLTLNPVKHLDLFGFLSMLIIGVGWAKPVPLNPNYYKNRKVGMAISAAAGPLANLVLAFLSMVLYKITWDSYLVSAIAGGSADAGPLWLYVLALVAFHFAARNVVLALFNLIPIPPLDGSRILGVVLPERVYFGIQRYERYIMIGLLVVVFVVPRVTSFDPLGWLLVAPMNAVMAGLDWMTGFVDMAFAAANPVLQAV